MQGITLPVILRPDYFLLPYVHC